MSLLTELKETLEPLDIPFETGVFSDEAPARYIVVVPLSDTFDFHADNTPGVDVQEARLSLYSQGNYIALFKLKILLQEAFALRDLNDNMVKVEYSNHNIQGFAFPFEKVNSLTNIQFFGGFVVEDIIGILKTAVFSEGAFQYDLLSFIKSFFKCTHQFTPAIALYILIFVAFR